MEQNTVFALIFEINQETSKKLGHVRALLPYVPSLPNLTVVFCSVPRAAQT